jgi:hypothetical protein
LELKGTVSEFQDESILWRKKSVVEVRLFFFLNFKETPWQEKHKTIFSGLSELTLSGQSDATSLFSTVRFTVLSVTLT